MPLYEITSNRFHALEETSFVQLEVRERADLQRMLRDQPQVLGEAIGTDLLIISEEFSDWEDSSRRVDLLALDTSANLVVIELKRSQDGGHMELQALRYAAMVSTLTFERAVAIYGKFLSDNHKDGSKAEAEILEFLGWDGPEDDAFAPDVSIVLVSGDFGKELTTTVLWLLERGLNIRCVRLTAYKNEAQKLVDVRQVIPLPEAEDYRVKLREKQDEERREKSDREQIRLRFWTQMAELCRQRGSIHGSRKPNEQGWFGCSISRLNFNYAIEKKSVRVEIYIDLGDADENKRIFDTFYTQREAIEKVFGDKLAWERLDTKRASRIRYDMEIGGWRSPQSEWPEIQEKMFDAMTRLINATRHLIMQVR
jgi:hypothetical protein